MGYIETENKHQTTLMPNKLDNYITKENPTRLIDAFINTLDLKQLGFTKTTQTTQGRPAYPPQTLLKLHIYGYYNKIRSSRKLERETKNSLEAIWLCNNLQPDHNTIANFRKDNTKPLKQVFLQWNLLCDKLDLFGKETQSIDGSKFKAVNSKDQNFTLPKLDDRINRINNHIEQHFTELEKNDTNKQDERKFTKEEIQEKIVELFQRKTLYETYREELEKNGETQKSLTDPEAKLMKFKGDYNVGYNIQTAIDSKHHLISEFNVTNKPSDNGLIQNTAQNVKKEFKLDTLETIQDKGYRDKTDMTLCLEEGIIPNIPLTTNEEYFELETNYEPTQITETQINSQKAQDIKTCLRSGTIPKIYQGIIKDIKITEIKIQKKPPSQLTLFNTKEDMIKKAQEGYFIRDLKTNTTYCPSGEKLRFYCTKKDITYYRNKLACERCLNKCCDAKFKTVGFGLGQNVVTCRSFGNLPTKQTLKRDIYMKQVVRFNFYPNLRKLDNRKCLSEHPFGTVKRWHDSSYLLLKGKEKVTGELSLTFLIYNIKRALNVLGMEPIMKTLTCKKVKTTFFSPKNIFRLYLSY